MCMAIVRPKVSQLRECMEQAVCRSLHQVVPFPPRQGHVVYFELQMGLQIGDSQQGEAAKHCLPCLRPNATPAPFPRLIQMPNRNDRDQRPRSTHPLPVGLYRARD